MALTRKEIDQRYRERHPERVLEKSRKHKEKIKATETPAEREARILEKAAYDRIYRQVNKDKRRQWAAADRERNREKIRAKDTKRRRERGIKPKVIHTPEKRRELNRARSKKNHYLHREERNRKQRGRYPKYKASQKVYYEKNKSTIIRRNNKHQSERRRRDPVFRLILSLRSSVGKYLDGRKKTKRIRELLGCTPEAFKAHLESQFTDGMGWHNYGRKGWCIDHIKPLSKFQNLATSIEEQRAACHYINCRPMWFCENCSKGNRHWPGMEKAA